MKPTESAKKITSITLSRFIEAGGELDSLQTLQLNDSPDGQVHVFTVEGRDGTYISDNADVSWFDAPASAVIEALSAGDTSEIGDPHGISEI